MTNDAARAPACGAEVTIRRGAAHRARQRTCRCRPCHRIEPLPALDDMTTRRAPLPGPILALLLAFAACGVHAQSAVPTPTIYGLLDVAAGSLQEPGQRHVLGLSSGAMSLSYLGIRGGDDLGGGLSARFGLETYVGVADGTAGRMAGDPFWARTAYVGFKGTFGTSLIGRLPTPLYTTTRLFNPFDESFAFSPAMRQWFGGTILGDSRWNDSVGYASPEPDGSGWNWLIHYNASDQLPASTGHNIGASLFYRSGPLLAAVTYQRVSNGVEVAPAGFDHQTAYQLNASYQLSWLRIYGQIGEAKTSATTSVRDHIYQLGGASPIGLGFLLVSYGHARAEIAGQQDTLRRTFSIGYDYFLSKNTDVYALAMNERVTALSSANSLAAGLRLRF
jgi:predicted porin